MAQYPVAGIVDLKLKGKGWRKDHVVQAGEVLRLEVEVEHHGAEVLWTCALFPESTSTKTGRPPSESDGSPGLFRGVPRPSRRVHRPSRARSLPCFCEGMQHHGPMFFRQFAFLGFCPKKMTTPLTMTRIQSPSPPSRCVCLP